MKRYLTYIFIALSIIILLIGLPIDLQWTGAVTWGLTAISLTFAAYFTKYIPDRQDKEQKKSRD